MSKINKKWIFRQLKNDLIGKDSQRGVTLTYSWFANQVGHFSLGFIPTILLKEVIDNYTDFENPAIITAIFISLFWLVFELYNFLGPLLKVTNKTFKPKWRNIAFDTITDLLFFFLGSFSASLFIFNSNINLHIVLLILLLLTYPICYWFITKMYQSYAFYPFQFRLSQWRFGLSTDNKKSVLDFINKENKGKHLMIFGSKSSGKTSLSIGILNELSIKHNTCLYITSMKLYSMFYFSEKNEQQIWSWKESEYLVIDDINPGDPIKENIVNSKKFLNFIDTSKDKNILNREILKNKNIIWVMGNEYISDKEYYSSWVLMLNELGVNNEQIESINLTK